MSFFEELKRRNVVRVGIAYAVIGWLLAQVAEFAFENFGAPEWVLKSFVVVLLLGLPVALLLAWAFEMTPEGLKREKDVDRSQSITRETGRKLDRLIIAVLVVAVIGLGVGQLRGNAVDPGAEAVSTQADRSIAVLPFVDLSTDQKDDYFGKGVAEELLNALAQFPELRVAARTSAFSFAGQDIDLREVGETLNVGHVLEGSIRRSGERIRITAQLIRASDGFHLWSETYERAMTDIFEIQDDIVRELTLALQVRLGIGVGTSRAHQKGIDPRAYESYLQGLNLWSNRHDFDNRVRAIGALRLATEIDPGFADAWSAYALSLMHSTTDPSMTTIPAGQWLTEVDNALAAALEADPDNARAHAGRALYFARHRMDLEKSREHGDRAVELAPNSAAARYARSSAAIVRGDYAEARREMRQARALDPLNIILERVHAQQNLITGFPAEAKIYFERCAEILCEGPLWSHLNLMEYAMFAGDETQSLELLALISEASKTDSQWIATGVVSLRWITLILNDDIEPLVQELESTSQGLGGSLSVLMPRILILAGEFDAALKIMQREQDSGGWFHYIQSTYMLAEGGFEPTDEFRKYPGYHRFFADNGFAQLARERIANGQTAGLPLNDDGSLVEF
jgi:TolB-like protein